MNIQYLIDNIKENINSPDLLDNLKSHYSEIGERIDGDFDRRESLEQYMQGVLKIIAEYRQDLIVNAVNHQEEWRLLNMGKFRINSRVSKVEFLNQWPPYQEVLKALTISLKADQDSEITKTFVYQQGQKILGDYGLGAYAIYFAAVSEISHESNVVIESWAEEQKEKVLKIQKRNSTPLSVTCFNSYMLTEKVNDEFLRYEESAECDDSLFF